jgi:sterol desaturase/sphingolipid hydroxylase (fatty acid hydroxylase superfamily)
MNLLRLSLQISAGLLAANATEWVVHKYVLHQLGARPSSFWAFHWHEHHRNSRKNGFRDVAYEASVLGQNSKSKEALALVAGGLLTLPLLRPAPALYATLVYSGLNYYRQHKRSHLDPAWARIHLPWHYDHHMGPNQHANWCVTRPWFDHLLGTREPYAHTDRELRDRELAAAARDRRRARQPSAA